VRASYYRSETKARWREVVTRQGQSMARLQAPVSSVRRTWIINLEGPAPSLPFPCRQGRPLRNVSLVWFHAFTTSLLLYYRPISRAHIVHSALLHTVFHFLYRYQITLFHKFSGFLAEVCQYSIELFTTYPARPRQHVERGQSRDSSEHRVPRCQWRSDRWHDT